MNSIKIGGEERPVCIGWGSLKEFGKLTGKTFGQVFEVSDLTFDDIEKLIFVSLKYGAKQEGEKFDIKLGDIEKWLEENINVVEKFVVIFEQELTAKLDEKNVPAPEAGQ